MSDNRREHPRVNAASLVNFAEFNAMRILKSLSTAATVDVSQGGLRIHCHESIPVSTVLEIELAVGEEILKAVGRVVFAREEAPGSYVMGLKFVDMSDADRERLDRFVDRRSKEKGAPPPQATLKPKKP